MPTTDAEPLHETRPTDAAVGPAEPAGELRLLHVYLAQRDVPCPRCRYNLRALHGHHCPECGEEVRLNVGLVHPKMKLMTAGLIGLAAGAGFSGLLLVYAAIMIAQGEYWEAWVTTFILVNLTGLLVLGGAMTGWLLAWRKIQRMPVLWRVALVCACWSASLLFVVVFAAVID